MNGCGRFDQKGEFLHFRWFDNQLLPLDVLYISTSSILDTFTAKSTWRRCNNITDPVTCRSRRNLFKRDSGFFLNPWKSSWCRWRGFLPSFQHKTCIKKDGSFDPSMLFRRSKDDDDAEDESKWWGFLLRSGQWYEGYCCWKKLFLEYYSVAYRREQLRVNDCFFFLGVVTDMKAIVVERSCF